ncbi:hypothetical protein [Rhodopila sp.]|uniref:hypothetical protein n=1 Tax=Rhodopila sp. TaxID=2480087 RepID=UPI003D0EAC44
MSDKIVEEAFTRVRGRYTDDVWFALPPRAITDAIYREIREIDAERLRAGPPTASTSLKSAAA